MKSDSGIDIYSGKATLTFTQQKQYCYIPIMGCSTQEKPVVLHYWVVSYRNHLYWILVHIAGSSSQDDTDPADLYHRNGSSGSVSIGTDPADLYP